jgi:hypothetical protein
MRGRDVKTFIERKVRSIASSPYGEDVDEISSTFREVSPYSLNGRSLFRSDEPLQVPLFLDLHLAH